MKMWDVRRQTGGFGEFLLRSASVLTLVLLLSVLAYGCGYQRNTGPETKEAIRLLSDDIKKFRRESGEVAIHAPDDLSLFASIYENIRRYYVRVVDRQDLIHAASRGIRAEYETSMNISDEDIEAVAIRAMLESLDPYSSYLDRQEFRTLNEETRGDFGGLGVEVSKTSGLLTVIAPIDDTPAARAGLLSGDIITHADRVLLAPLSLREAAALLRGEVGSTVMLTLEREKQRPFDIVLEREIIEVRSVRYRMEGEVGYIRITNFSEDTGEKLYEAIRDLLDSPENNLRAFVLDLRDNPGGLLSEAQAVASSFLDGGPVVEIKSRDETESFTASSGDPSENLPVVVLVDRGSASASEIVAGALKDRSRAILLGEKTYGKGSVQSLLHLRGGRGLKLTTAVYYTPNGQTVEGGIIPNLTVEQDAEHAGDEPLQEGFRLAIEMAGGPTVFWTNGMSQ